MERKTGKTGRDIDLCIYYERNEADVYVCMNVCVCVERMETHRDVEIENCK